jgi:hypothetical protein
MSPRLVVAGALVGIWADIRIEPGYGSAEERAATLDALTGPFRVYRGDREATLRETVP